MRCHRADRDARSAEDRGRAQLAAGSVYVVKPKMHGPEEVAFADEIFARVEECWACPRTPSSSASWTRSGAPRSTSRNASAPRRHRVAFINTGFLDRTGDEIHTSMEAGPMIRKGEMKTHALDHGLRGPQRRYRPGLRAAGPGADRQGHVGDARPDGRDAGGQRSAIRRPGRTAPGCRRRPRRRCTRRITTRSTCCARQDEIAGGRAARHAGAIC